MSMKNIFLLLLMMLGVQGSQAIASMAQEVPATIILNTGKPAEPPFLYSVRTVAQAEATPQVINQVIAIRILVVQGTAGEVSLGIQGSGDVGEVTGEHVESWGVRRAGSDRFLDLRLKPGQEEYEATVRLQTAIAGLPSELELAHFSPGKSLGFDSRIEIDFTSGIVGKVVAAEGFFLPSQSDGARTQLQTSSGGRLALQLGRSSAQPPAVELVDSRLTGQRHPNGNSVTFRLTGSLQVRELGARLRLLSGQAALSQLPADGGYRLQLVEDAEGPRYELVCDQVGTFAIDIEFVAAVLDPQGSRRGMDFTVATNGVVPLVLTGFEQEIEFQQERGYVVPVLNGESWQGFLPATGHVQIGWKNSQSSGEGKLFFATSARIDTQVDPGLLRQEHRLEYQILQGQLKGLSIAIDGPGEILAVEGPHVVGWKIVDQESQRQLEITLGQAVTSTSEFVIRSQSAVGSFPVRVEGMRLRPLGAIRHSGLLRVANSGSVRIEPTGLMGLTQLSPEQFPGEPIQARQVFVYRFPAADHTFSLIADRIQPEVSITQLLVYQMNENSRVINAKIELDIREAGLREWDMLLPGDYSVVSVIHPGQDYVAATEIVDGKRNLKLIFGQDLQGRQLVQVRLEKNEQATVGVWDLPRIDYPATTKSIRGEIGVASEAGFRVIPSIQSGLVDKPVASFPEGVVNLQHAYRLREANWSAAMQIERMERSIQADMFHLYSLSQGTIYGSALVNYFITGAPLADLELSVPVSLANVTVDGQDIRTWRREGDRLLVSLQQGVMGPYTLLVTFEETPSVLDGTFQPGLVAPIGVQGDRGYIEVVSPIQVSVVPQLVSSQLLLLDPLELPAEFRLLSTAPPLGTWQYTERPFELKVKVDWYEPGTTVAQVVEYAEANSRVSPDGELVTDVVYFVKSREQRALRVELPGAPVRLWGVTVAGQPVTARQSGNETLIPLPESVDSGLPIEVGLRLGKPTEGGTTAEVALPVVKAPILKTVWRLQGDENHALLSLPGAGASAKVSATIPPLWPSGLQWLAGPGFLTMAIMVLLVIVGLIAAMQRSWVQHLAILFFALAVSMACRGSWDAWQAIGPPHPLSVDVPVMASGESLALTIKAIPSWRAQISWTGVGLMLGGLFVLGLRFVCSRNRLARMALFAACALFATGSLLQTHGGILFFAAVAVIGVIAWLIPALQRGLGALKAKFVSNRRDAVTGEERPEGGSATSVVTSLWACVIVSMMTTSVMAQSVDEPTKVVSRGIGATEIAAAESLNETWRVESRSKRLTATGTLVGSGKVGDRFVLVTQPAVLTRFEGPGLRLSTEEIAGLGFAYVVTVVAEAGEGSEEQVRPITAQFDYRLEDLDLGAGIDVLTGRAALHQVRLEYDQTGWDVTCVAAARVELIPGNAGETTAKILLGSRRAPIVVQPQARDVMLEEVHFFVEGSQLYIPSPGVVDGVHRMRVRTAQGRVQNLQVIVPSGLTVSSVEGPIDSWQFDADAHRLLLQVDPLAEGNFEILVETQQSVSALPVDLVVEPLRVEQADGEVGMLAVAFGADAQPEKMDSASFSQVNSGDFDTTLIRDPGVTLHRVYRYGVEAGNITMRIATVAAEVRLTSRQIVSLGEERIVLNIQFTAEIARTGLFQLSFPLPSGYEVESLTGESLSHWSEIREEEERLVVLHLNGKTIGSQAFSLVLAGAVPQDATEWEVPRFSLREASRHTGDLVVNPVTGIRIRSLSRQNVSELDPRAVGGEGNGSLAFRLLQNDWSLSLGIEQLDAWIVGQALHEVTLREGQTRSTVYGDFTVQNATIRALRVELPIRNSDELKTVRASGKQVSDFVRVEGEDNVWELRFKRRVMGRVEFQIEYERRGERVNNSEDLVPLVFSEVRQIAYYFAVRVGGRLEIEPAAMPAGWQIVDWNTIPAPLRATGNRSTPPLALRAIGTTAPLGIRIERHSLAEALKLRVVEGTLNTIISPTGDQLHGVDVTMEVVQRSNLSVVIPEGGELFSVFVNGESVHSIRQRDQGNTWQFYILPGMDDRTAQVRIIYLVRGDGIDKLRLASPQLNVPLENVKWQVMVPQGFELLDHDGDLELVGEVERKTFDRPTYLAAVDASRNQRAKQAEQLLEQAGQLLQAGEQGKAWRAYNNVANRNALDAASNEDARVQLENLQTQQAIVGLNTRRQRLFLDNEGSEAALAGSEQLRQAAAVNPVLQQEQMNFRPQEMSQLLAGNSNEDNTVLQRIAGRLVQHQRAAEAAPRAIAMSVPEDGTIYRFSRGVQVAENSPLELELRLGSIYGLRAWQWIAVIGAVVVISLSVLVHRKPSLFPDLRE